MSSMGSLEIFISLSVLSKGLSHRMPGVSVIYIFQCIGRSTLLYPLWYSHWLYRSTMTRERVPRELAALTRHSMWWRAFPYCFPHPPQVFLGKMLGSYWIIAGAVWSRDFLWLWPRGVCFCRMVRPCHCRTADPNATAVSLWRNSIKLRRWKTYDTA